MDVKELLVEETRIRTEYFRIEGELESVKKKLAEHTKDEIQSGMCFECDSDYFRVSRVCGDVVFGVSLYKNDFCIETDSLNLSYLISGYEKVDAEKFESRKARILQKFE
jgi:hypothetical protein